jgi:hypothetical protein
LPPSCVPVDPLILDTPRLTLPPSPQTPPPPVTKPTRRKAGGALKIVHEVYSPKNDDGLEGLTASLEAAMSFNDGIRPHLGRCADDLHPLRAQALLAAIPDDALVRPLIG